MIKFVGKSPVNHQTWFNVLLPSLGHLSSTVIRKIILTAVHNPDYHSKSVRHLIEWGFSRKWRWVKYWKWRRYLKVTSQIFGWSNPMESTGPMRSHNEKEGSPRKFDERKNEEKEEGEISGPSGWRIRSKKPAEQW